MSVRQDACTVYFEELFTRYAPLENVWTAGFVAAARLVLYGHWEEVEQDLRASGYLKPDEPLPVAPDERP